MSSVTRFIRQIPVSTTYYDAGASAAALTPNAYAFIPTNGNYVGNYTPGYMQQASTAPINTPGASVSSLIANALANPGAAGLVLRDMGKTIYAPSTDPLVSGSATVFGYFREVQLIAPNAIGFGTANQMIGGTSGSNFGVIGPSPDYLTFYIPVTVAGVRVAASANVNVIAGGQM